MKKLRAGIILLFIVLIPLAGDSQKVYNNLDSSRHIFQSMLLYKDAIKKGTTNYYRSTFTGKATFQNAYFKGWADFDSATIENGNFENVTFDTAFFNNTFFNFSTDFFLAKFKYQSTFYGAIFSSMGNFTNTNFAGNANFSKTVFKDGAVFYSASFQKRVNFYGASFSNYTDFSHLKFTDSAKTRFIFDSVKLPNIINFSSNPYIPCEIDLSSADYKDPKYYDSKLNQITATHRIYLYKSDISKFHFDYFHFKLTFTDPTNPGYVIPNDEKEAIYEALLANFKSRGQELSYEELDKEYQDFKWSIQPWPLSYLGNIIKWWWNFGYNKEWVFRNTFFLVLFFTLVNFFFLNKLNSVYHISFIPKDLGNIKGLWYSLIYTCIVFFPLALTRDNIKKTSGWLVYIVFIYLTGLLCVAYMANFVLAK